MQRDTLDVMVSRLAPGGVFYLATDILDYAEMSAQLLTDTPGLTAQHHTPWVDSWPGRVLTKYERKARREGRACYYFAYERNTYPAPAIPVKEELPVPHLVVYIPLDLETMMQLLDLGETYTYGDLRVRFMNCYRNVQALLFETYIHEPTIDQHVAITLSGREQDHEYTLKMSSLGSPRITEGAHFAVGTLGKLLVALHPDAKILRNLVGSNFR